MWECVFVCVCVFRNFYRHLVNFRENNSTPPDTRKENVDSTGHGRNWLSLVVFTALRSRSVSEVLLNGEGDPENLRPYTISVEDGCVSSGSNCKVLQTAHNSTVIEL